MEALVHLVHQVYQEQVEALEVAAHRESQAQVEPQDLQVVQEQVEIQVHQVVQGQAVLVEHLEKVLIGLVLGIVHLIITLMT